MFSKVLIFVLLGAAFVAANPVTFNNDVDGTELRGWKENIGDWLKQIQHRVKSFIQEGKDNVASILQKVKEDRVKLTELTKNRLKDLRQKIAALSKDVINEVGSRKDLWLSRLEELKEEGKILIKSSIEKEIEDINTLIKNFLGQRVKNGKQELIELMDELKKILNESELNELKNKLEEAVHEDDVHKEEEKNVVPSVEEPKEELEKKVEPEEELEKKVEPELLAEEPNDEVKNIEVEVEDEKNEEPQQEKGQEETQEETKEESDELPYEVEDIEKE